MSDTQEIVIPESDQPSEEGSTPEAPAAAAETPAPSSASVAGGRAPASDLEGDLRKVLDDFVSGTFKFAEGVTPTPHALAAEIAKRRGDGRPVSSGAVSAALVRWVEIGFCTVSSKPTAFVDYTDAARSQGLSALKAAARSAKSSAKKAVAEPAVPPTEATASAVGTVEAPTESGEVPF